MRRVLWVGDSPFRMPESSWTAHVWHLKVHIFGLTRQTLQKKKPWASCQVFAKQDVSMIFPVCIMAGGYDILLHETVIQQAPNDKTFADFHQDLLPWIRDALGSNFVAEHFHQLVPTSPRGSKAAGGLLRKQRGENMRTPLKKQAVQEKSGWKLITKWWYSLIYFFKAFWEAEFQTSGEGREALGTEDATTSGELRAAAAWNILHLPYKILIVNRY